MPFRLHSRVQSPQSGLTHKPELAATYALFIFPVHQSVSLYAKLDRRAEKNINFFNVITLFSYCDFTLLILHEK